MPPPMQLVPSPKCSALTQTPSRTTRQAALHTEVIDFVTPEIKYRSSLRRLRPNEQPAAAGMAPMSPIPPSCSNENLSSTVLTPFVPSTDQPIFSRIHSLLDPPPLSERAREKQPAARMGGQTDQPFLPDDSETERSMDIDHDVDVESTERLSISEADELQSDDSSGHSGDETVEDNKNGASSRQGANAGSSNMIDNLQLDENGNPLYVPVRLFSRSYPTPYINHSFTSIACTL
jgi:hypothetical protein